MILLAVACLIFVSCNNKKATEPVEEPKSEFAANLDKWATFGDLEEEGQVALVAEMKAYIDECCKEKCKEAEEGEEPCPEKEAFKAKWATFETLTLEEQKEIIDQVFEHMKACCQKEAEVAEVPEEVPAE